MNKSINKAFKNLFKEPQTIKYPLEPIKKPEGYRGLIEYGEEYCIYCLKCEKVCPPGAILFVPTDTPSDNEKNKKGLEYRYNEHLCIYCGECVRACPKPDEALWQSEKKPSIAVKSDRVNDGWFEVEELKSIKKVSKSKGE
ncbi:MAG: 4Fe-4S binding protein [Campylobacterota bacterium]|nr:4Fe-4S binding protein [Campylobacterota bacterium]